MISIREKAQKWLQQDQNLSHKKHIEALLKIDSPDLIELFNDRLRFGTAGLRGEMGPGPNRMNESVVARTSKAIADYVNGRQTKTTTVVIGYDARHNSKKFAHIAAGVFASNGCRVFLFDEIVPTPLLSYAVTSLNTSIGIMVTASHNPPKDNGYKVYWSNGAQIIPPHDSGISAVLDSLPMKPIPSDQQSDLIEVIPKSMGESYLSAVQKLRVHRTSNAKVVYTPLHGVGGKWVENTLTRAGHKVHLVTLQAAPDGAFPHAPFPNPEEKGSMDLAFQLASDIKADIAIANDPDADRLAVVVQHEGVLHQLTGDQVGLILAEDLLLHGDWGECPLVATTIVSSSQLKQIAEAHNADYAETLTGFKWIANEAIEHDKGKGRFVIGFEEALGYSVGDVARDKDGVSAALLIADLCAVLKEQGKTIIDYLNEIRAKYGVASSRQVSIKMPGSEGKREIRQIMDDLRDDPPTRFAGSEILNIRDIQLSTSFDVKTNKSAEINLPKSNVLAFDAQNERIIVRPSGTEPKIKFYFEVKTRLTNHSSIDAAISYCDARIDELIADLQTKLQLG